jgi:hypothetical protein
MGFGNKLKSKKQLQKVALVYDFDGTLSPGNMQEYGFINAVKMDRQEFWEKSNGLSEKNNASKILCYMQVMMEEAKSKDISLKRDSFQRFGKEVKFFDGVKSWFCNINTYGKSMGLDIHHYINSSGLKEIIEGTSIAKEFDEIYACSFMYNIDGIATWPAVAVDYTTKTQFIFKINKGITSISDDKKINEYIPEEQRPIPFRRMIYFGDGSTDIPCMKMVKQKGGHSIAVYAPRNKEKKNAAEQLIIDGRVNFVCPADYSKDKEVYKVVATILDKIRSDYDFESLLKQHRQSAEDIISRLSGKKNGN